MNARTIAHRARDTIVRVAAHRAFQPLSETSHRLAIVRPDHFGDLLMLTPALEYLHKSATDHEIILMVGPWNEQIALHVAPFCTVATFPYPGFDRDGSSNDLLAPYRAVKDAAAQLRDLKPHAIALMRDDHWWGAWAAREAGIPLRFGYDDPTVAPHLTHPMTVEHQHYVAQNIVLAQRALTALGYHPRQIDDATIAYPLSWPEHTDGNLEANALLIRNGVDRPFIVVHPGTGASVKLWAEQRWAAVADQLGTATNCQIVLTGSADESKMCKEVAAMCRRDVIILAGQTTLFTLAEILRQARLVLGVDSGPLHLATAVDTRSIHLYGPSDSTRYGPWGDLKRHRTLRAKMSCPDCGNLSASRPAGCGCMTAIGVDQVVSTALEMLSNER